MRPIGSDHEPDRRRSRVVRPRHSRHLDVIGRAAASSIELHVLVVHNPDKSALLPIAQRVSLIQDSIADAKLGDNILVTSWSVGLLVDYCTDVGASVLVKGIRSQVDVAYETRWRS
jgi:pantetheine-phosphate adenylyltransferase